MSVWTTPIARPLDPDSAAVVARLVKEARNPLAPASINYGGGPRVCVVDATQPRVPVVLDLYQPDMRAMFAEGVPIPEGTKPGNNSDHSLLVLQGNSYWEMWEARLAEDGWHCKWGGLTTRYDVNPGYFGPGDWVSADGKLRSRVGWGQAASRITMLPGLVTGAELHAAIHDGEPIDHALTLLVPWARAGVSVWPAQMTDGRDAFPDSVPEGARLILDPALNTDAIGNLGLRELVRAAQTYGMICRDQTGQRVGFDVAATDPAYPWSGLLGFDTETLMAHFPWESLKLLPMTLS